MKIKTITCHEVYNHGASLQEYALLKFLNDNGFDAETIHYKPDYLSQHFKLNAVANKFDFPILKQLYLLAKLPNRLKMLKRKKAFDLFAQKYIKTDETLYRNNEQLKNNLPIADAFICGSDQIWNSFFQNGKDPAFYLDFVPDSKLKISYAASFAIDELEESIKDFVKEKVSKINCVSVRETSGVKILNDLGLTNVEQVLDPVFLLDRKIWEMDFVKPINLEFIFIYDFDSNPEIKKAALRIKNETGFKIFTVNKNITYADKNFYLEGPEKFLSLIYSSKFTITNSFHAVAFSLIFNKKFIVVNRSEKINTRMRDLLSLFNLNDLLVDKDINNNILKNSTINYESLMEKHVVRSKNILLNFLKI